MQAFSLGTVGKTRKNWSWMIFAACNASGICFPDDFGTISVKKMRSAASPPESRQYIYIYIHTYIHGYKISNRTLEPSSNVEVFRPREKTGRPAIKSHRIAISANQKLSLEAGFRPPQSKLKHNTLGFAGYRFWIVFVESQQSWHLYISCIYIYM